jgi:hypothetical protein
MKYSSVAAALMFALLIIPAPAWAQRTKAPEGAAVYFITPTNGAAVSSPLTVSFGLKGLGVAPAGTEKASTGHHHLLIDQKLEDYDAAIPADDTHKHFGGGQTETSIELTPGQHTLQLVVGDLNHIPHDPPIESETITITVK